MSTPPQRHRGSAFASADTVQSAAGLAAWALQFTPRVALVHAAGGRAPVSAVVLELAASTRLWGGRRAMLRRIHDEALDVGVTAFGCAPTSLAALALARAGVRNGFARPLPQVLDGQPLVVLDAVAAHGPMLARLGCQTLGQVRALPRAGLARRFGAGLLNALDQAYGEQAEVHAWLQLPEVFQGRLELPSRVMHAPALLFAARRLVLQLCGWLAARQAGVTAFTVQWRHDAMRARATSEGGQLCVRMGEPSRDAEHLLRLLAEHLAHQRLEAPVGEVLLHATHLAPLGGHNAALLPDPRANAEALPRTLERIAARLGDARVRRPMPRADHRQEWMCDWVPASQWSARQAQAGEPARDQRAGAPGTASAGAWASSQGAAHDLAHGPAWPQPSFVLNPPMPLRVDGHGAPLHHGPLQLLLGPQRVESGWWHVMADHGMGMGLNDPFLKREVAHTHGHESARNGASTDSARAQPARARAGHAPVRDAPASTSAHAHAHAHASASASADATGSPAMSTEHSALVARDYWLALSAQAGVLWIFQARASHAGGASAAWFLHGIFA